MTVMVTYSAFSCRCSKLRSPFALTLITGSFSMMKSMRNGFAFTTTVVSPRATVTLLLLLSNIRRLQQIHRCVSKQQNISNRFTASTAMSETHACVQNNETAQITSKTTSNTKAGFVALCQDKIQRHSRTKPQILRTFWSGAYHSFNLQINCPD